MLFSERYGYTSPRFVLRRENLDEESINGLCTCYDYLAEWLNEYDSNNFRRFGCSYAELEEFIWCFFCNKRKDSFWYNEGGHRIVATAYLEDNQIVWYEKLNLIDYTVDYLKKTFSNDKGFQDRVDAFVSLIDSTFKRLDLAYRIVDNHVVAITDEEELVTIEDALAVSDNVKVHLSRALVHLSSRPNPDYRNSIKESISAVEAICREITGESDLGDALKMLNRRGVAIPKMLQVAFEKLYAYTNNKTTGIRHALMEDTESPEFDEAKFMLVACSAFVNYLRGKQV